MTTLLDYLTYASETARREHPEPMPAADLAACWSDYEQGVYRTSWVPDLFAEVMRLRALIQAFGAGGFDLDAAAALYAEGQRMLDSELSPTAPPAMTRGG